MTKSAAAYVPITLDEPRGGSFLRWDDTERFESGFHIGSQGDDGEHIRTLDGWPYSVYRQACQAGVTDVVICHGIQSLHDAIEICDRLQALS